MDWGRTILFTIAALAAAYVGLWMLVVGLALWRRRRRRVRREAMAALASQHGMSYQRRDLMLFGATYGAMQAASMFTPIDTSPARQAMRWLNAPRLPKPVARYGKQVVDAAARAGEHTPPFRLLVEGDGSGTESILRGVWKGAPVTAFDYFVFESKLGAFPMPPLRSYTWYSCVVAEIPADCPHLVLERETRGSRLANKLVRDVELESEEFNRTFLVGCVDRQFAHAFLDASMMAWLLEQADGLRFEVNGSQVLCYTDRVAPEDLPELLDRVADFCARIPRVVPELYPAATA